MTRRDAEMDVIRRDYEALTAEHAASGPHPNEDVWIRLAGGELSEPERTSIVDHVLTCAECSAVYRAVAHVSAGAASFDPAAPSGRAPSSWRTYWLPAVAASLTIAAAGLLAWNVTLQRRTAELRGELERARQTRPLPPRETPPAAPPGVQAHVNVPIVDLHPPSRVRGDGTRLQVITLPKESALVTLIVNTDRRAAGTYALELLGASGTILWTGTGLTPQSDGTLSVALPAALVPAGGYTFVLKEDGRTIHRYPVTFAAQ